MLVSYDWIKEYIGEKTPSSEEVVDLLTAHAFEIEGVEGEGEETVIDVDILPNRSSDCLSQRGVAREVATLAKLSMAQDPLAETVDLPSAENIEATIADSEACPRFTAMLVEGVTVKPSPEWLQKRLKLLGQKPINNIVDITNYVMYAIGQPVHAYDADLFPATDGVWQFGVRNAVAEEKIQLLGEKPGEEERVVNLNGSELLVVDKKTDTPIGLAGVKGGAYAGVHEKSTRILIEAAHFDPVRTRKTARLHNIVIDASKRFENEPSRDLPSYAQYLAATLLKEVAGGEIKGFYDKYPNPKIVPTVAVDPQRVNQLLGLVISREEMVEILHRVGVEVDDNGDVLNCTGPFERTDLNIEEDFIEEIGRVFGYDHVESTMPDSLELKEYNNLHYYSEKIRKILQEQGFSEVITSSFRKKDKIKLRNSLASDKSFLRSGLTNNIQEALEKNIFNKDILGLSDIKVFEIGTVFTKAENELTEHIALGLGALIKQGGYSGKEDKILTSAKKSLEEALDTEIQWQEHKGVAELNLSELVKGLPPVAQYEEVVASPKITYIPFSVYPAIARDIALWVSSDTDANKVAETILQSLSNDKAVPSWDAKTKQLKEALAGVGNKEICLQRLDLFDTFSKEDRVSYAFRLVFQSYEKTLTDEEVQECMEKIYEAVADEGWEVR